MTAPSLGMAPRIKDSSHAPKTRMAHQDGFLCQRFFLVLNRGTYFLANGTTRFFTADCSYVPVPRHVLDTSVESPEIA